MNAEHLEFAFRRETRKRPRQPKEFKVVALRECPMPAQMMICDTPQAAVEYWQRHVTTNVHFDPNRECLVVLLLNTRTRIRGHVFLSHGTLDSLLVRPAEVFRPAVVDGGTNSVIIMHNHPSGDPTPSQADIQVTRDLIRAGQLLKIEVLDHVIIGNPRFCSLRELGFLA
jgi:DNA repair protein RadC